MFARTHDLLHQKSALDLGAKGYVVLPNRPAKSLERQSLDERRFVALLPSFAP
jgi:predicted aspartyl protease